MAKGEEGVVGLHVNFGAAHSLCTSHRAKKNSRTLTLGLKSHNHNAFSCIRLNWGHHLASLLLAGLPGRASCRPHRGVLPLRAPCWAAVARAHPHPVAIAQTRFCRCAPSSGGRRADLRGGAAARTPWICCIGERG
jgi:hypothetical protein